MSCNFEGGCYAPIKYKERDECPWCKQPLNREGGYISIAVYENDKLARFQCPRCLRTFT